MTTLQLHSAQGRHLSREQLGQLLRENGETTDVDTCGHLEKCELCQSRLTTLAAEPSWWDEAQEFLSDGVEPRWEPDTSQLAIQGGESVQTTAAVDDTVRELLGKPKHPEMLGRLGRYDIERVIGHGGMGIVLKAHDCELNRPIAIKLLAGHLAHVGAARARFAREGRAAAAVVHEHVVAIYNVETEGRVPFLVMQYVPGRSLQSRVDEDGTLGAEEILRIGMQAAGGLAAAHRQGLVHRDVKPSNILLEDTVERAVLTDFGLARTLDDASLTHTGILAGTPHYMSPEQSRGEPIDARSDLFSLGAVLYFMATGHPPFRASGAMAVLHRICNDSHRPVWQWNREIPDQISDVIDRLLEKKPQSRFASAEEVQQELARLLSLQQQQGLGHRRFRRRGSRRLNRILAIGSTVLLGLAVIVAAATKLGRQTTTSPPSTAPRAMERAALTQTEGQYLSELQEIDAVLGTTSDESFFLQGTDSWSRELEGLRHQLDRIEANGNTTNK
jgi:eukaryotic-like serine/threonine-protein kinase